MKNVVTEHDFKVLIVDDDTIFIKLLVFYIKSSGFKGKILQAYNGEEAVELCKKEFPSIIFMDVQMPVLNGILATREIRGTGYKNPILIVSSYAELERDRCLAAGADRLILKPVTRDDFLASFKEYYPDRNKKLSKPGLIHLKPTMLD
ncbi:MAG: response regulator [Candidatus Neomarinimicrobiota bacterium]